MGSSIACFLLQPTSRYRVNLRRYSKVSMCPANAWCHNADVFIGIEEHLGKQPLAGDHSREDPRWPIKCDRCSYNFDETDEWQKNHDVIWLAPDGQEYTLISADQMTNDKSAAAPVGAIWRATWLEPTWVGPDGHSYVVRTPGGDWQIDGGFGPPHQGGWQRMGDAPNFTVTPSILIGKRSDGSWVYHGWLKNGRLEEC